MTVRLRPGTPLAATGGLVTVDPVWDTAGDVALATGPDAAVKLVAGTEGGTALTADPNATNKASYSSPTGVDLRSRGATSSLASTYDRATAVETSSSNLTTAKLQLTRILLPKGLLITSITYWSMTTALSVGVNQWFGLFDSSRNMLRVTGDDTSTAWAANSAKTLNLSSTFTTTYAGWHYLGISVKATTVPSLVCVASLGTANIRIAAPLICGLTSDTGLTNPASCPNPAGAITSAAAIMYAEVS